MTLQCSQVFGLLLLLCCWPLLTAILKAEKMIIKKISYSFTENQFSVADNKKELHLQFFKRSSELSM